MKTIEFNDLPNLDFFSIISKSGDADFMKTGEHEAICMKSEHYRYKAGKYEYFKLNTLITPEKD